MEEDAADRDARRERVRAQKERILMKRRSQAVQMNLPRPMDVPASLTKASDAAQTGNALALADDLIKAEMPLMLQHDLSRYPVPGAPPQPKVASIEDDFADEELEAARAMIAEEAAAMRGRAREEGHPIDDKGEIDSGLFWQTWRECLEEITYIPSQQRYGRTPLVDKKDRLDALEAELNSNRGHMRREEKRAKNMETKMDVLTKGYQNVAVSTIKQINELAERIAEMARTRKGFELLHTNEKGAILRRVETLSEDVAQQQRRETHLQLAYKNLITERENVIERARKTVEVANGAAQS
eukprot:Opistho-2@90527